MRDFGPKLLSVAFVSALFSALFSLAAYASPQEDANKKLVQAFYEEAFTNHKAKEAAEKYLSSNYIQHNPNVPTGRQPFIDFFVPFFKKNAEARSQIKRMIAEGDLVVVHVHSQANAKDPGRAVVDIFRVNGGKIVEHWDVMQPVTEKAANQNSMF